MGNLKQLKLILLSAITFVSCSNGTKTINAYNKNEGVIKSAYESLYNIVTDDTRITISTLRLKEEIEVFYQNNSNTVAFYLDSETFDLIDTRPTTAIDNDSLAILNAVVTAPSFVESIKKLIACGVKGIELGSNWMFVTFGLAGSKLNHPDVMNGILITEKDVTTLATYIQTLEKNVYLVDLVIL